MAISLANVVRNQSISPPRIVLYGVGGIGKTTWAAGAPKPIFLCTEKGLGRLSVDAFHVRPGDPVLASWEEIIGCLQALHRDEHDYATVVLDTLDFAEPLLWRYTATLKGETAIEDIGYQKGYIYALDHAQVMLDWLDRLSIDRQMASIVLCHHEVKKFDPPDSEPYDRYKLRVHDKLADRVRNWADAVLFANYKTTVVKDGGGKTGKPSKARGVGRGERVIYTEERPAYWAKNRYGLPLEMDLGAGWAAFEPYLLASDGEDQKSMPTETAQAG